MTLGGAVDALRSAVSAVMDVVDVPILVYFVLVNSSYLVLIGLAVWKFVHYMRRVDHTARESVLSSRLAQGVSVLMPTHNEEAGIVTAVRSMLSLRYPRHEVVVIDDGSADRTFERLRAAFDLVPIDRELPADIPTRVEVRSVHVPRDGRTRLIVLHKDNSGRSDAVNMGINASSEPLVVCVDADSILDPDALLTVTQPFAEDPTRMVATGGVIRAANGSVVEAGRVVEPRLPRGWLARVQVVEYLRSFLLGRAGWSRLGCLILISGAFGVFRRDVLVEVGGLDADSIGEDFELVMRIHQHLRRAGRDYRVDFVAEPVCWTEVPETTAVLRRQRSRWHRGLWETLWKYRGMCGNPRYRAVGLLAVPYYWLFELVAPLLEVLGLVLVVAGLLLGVVDVSYALLFVCVAYLYALFVVLVAMTVEELTFHRYRRWRDLGGMFLAAVVENLGYRQLTALWRLEGWAASLFRRPQRWGTMTRRGFDDGSGADGDVARGATTDGVTDNEPDRSASRRAGRS